mmetsp:Transcript_59958/g.167386  ORF Transcript_59958/g.167386 Transcript_59958/m.167386 type:complete len:675 (+) Transcript_59958:55-2079(+)
MMANFLVFAAVPLLASLGAHALQAELRDDGASASLAAAAARLASARAAEEARLAAMGVDLATKERAAFVKGAAPVPPLSEPGDDTELIFEVSAFRDGERCGRSLFYAFARAARPARLSVRVLQARDDTDDDCLHRFRADHLDSLCAKDGFMELVSGQPAGAGSGDPAQACRDVVLSKIHAWAIRPNQAKGPVHQRGMANLLLEFESTEAMCLSTDSHMGFWMDWDRVLIQEWLTTRNEFAVLSVYPTQLSLMNENPNTTRMHADFCGYEHEVSGMERGMPRGIAGAPKMRIPGAKPHLSMNWAAGFSFHRCHAERLVPVDWRLRWVFTGEEVNRAVRLWTHGYDLYVPVMPVVLHDYTSAKQLFWQYRDEKAIKRSQRRLRKLLSMGGDTAGAEEPVAPYALGSQRTMEQFVNWSRQDLGETWGPWLAEHGLEPQHCSWGFCRNLTRLAVADEVALVASVGAAPPERGTVRLSAFPSGRLEVYDGTRWGAVCGNPWAAGAAGGPTAVCQQLGYDAGVSSAGSRHAIRRPPVVGNRACNGSEATFFDCPLRDGVRSEFEGCRDGHDAWLTCRNASALSHRDDGRGCCQVSQRDNKCAVFEYPGERCCNAGEPECSRPRCEQGHWAEDAVYDKQSGACVHPARPLLARGAAGRGHREPPQWCRWWDGGEAYPVPVH